MIVISDTNILSSLAAGDSLHLLSSLFPPAQICIPPAAKEWIPTAYPNPLVGGFPLRQQTTTNLY